MKTMEHYSFLYLVIRTWPQIEILKIQQPDLFTNILNPQQPGDKQAGKQDGAKQKPKANAPAGQENKATNKNAAEKNKEEDPQAALEKDVDELRKAIDGELKLNLPSLRFGFSFSILSRFSHPFIADFTYCVNVVTISMLCYFFRSPVVSQIAVLLSVLAIIVLPSPPLLSPLPLECLVPKRHSFVDRGAERFLGFVCFPLSPTPLLSNPPLCFPVLSATCDGACGTAAPSAFSLLSLAIRVVIVLVDSFQMNETLWNKK